MSVQVAPMGMSAGGMGTHPCIQTNTADAIQVIYRAEFDKFCCEPDSFGCCGTGIDTSRKYFYVLENSYEMNFPIGRSDNWCCPGMDSIRKFYFDRGLYDQQGCHRSCGLVSGTPVAIAGATKYTCFCIDCCDCYNKWTDGCLFPSWCGDRVRVLPYETVCCCCPTRGHWMNNCCGLCGVKTGEPIPSYMWTMAQFLRVGTGVQLAQALEGARAAWKARTGHK